MYSRATDPFQRSLRTRSRSPAAAEKSIDVVSSTSNNTPNDISRSRSRSRYRSSTTSTSTDNSISDFSPNVKPTATPILFRRRSRPTTTARTTTTTRSTTTTTTTPRPTTQRITSSPDKNDKSEEDESEYYYYYYDEDEDETPSTGTSSKTNKGSSDDLLHKSQTQRTTGLRTTDFATASSNAGQVEKGFTKRNLHHRNSAVASQFNSTTNNNAIVVISTKAPTTAPAKGEVSSTTNSNTHRRRVNYDRSYDSFGSSTINRKSQQTYQKEKAPIALKSIDIDSSAGDGKWSPRAVVPLSEKIKLREDGSVQCLDKGIFPHPVSCRQFVHCAASDSNDGAIRSWLYMCPKTLSFDAVGGMCNWTNDNACIE